MSAPGFGDAIRACSAIVVSLATIARIRAGKLRRPQRMAAHRHPATAAVQDQTDAIRLVNAISIPVATSCDAVPRGIKGIRRARAAIAVVIRCAVVVNAHVATSAASGPRALDRRNRDARAFSLRAIHIRRARVCP